MTTTQTETTSRTCTCGRPIGTSRFAVQCGRCSKARIRAAQQGARHEYTRTHVHVAPDGRRSMQDGPPCPGDAVLQDEHTVTTRWIEPRKASA